MAEGVLGVVRAGVVGAVGLDGTVVGGLVGVVVGGVGDDGGGLLGGVVLGGVRVGSVDVEDGLTGVALLELDADDDGAVDVLEAALVAAGELVATVSDAVEAVSEGTPTIAVVAMGSFWRPDSQAFMNRCHACPGRSRPYSGPP